jgi:hypothetical protein
MFLFFTSFHILVNYSSDLVSHFFLRNMSYQAECQIYPGRIAAGDRAIHVYSLRVLAVGYLRQ